MAVPVPANSIAVAEADANILAKTVMYSSPLVQDVCLGFGPELANGKVPQISAHGQPLKAGTVLGSIPAPYGLTDHRDRTRTRRE